MSEHTEAASKDGSGSTAIDPVFGTPYTPCRHWHDVGFVGGCEDCHRDETEAAINAGPGIAAIESLRCRCVWNGERCPHPATQEDGRCDWCGVRTPEQLMSNPNVLLSPTGEFLGLGGAGYAHVDPDRTPDACWMEPDR